METRRGRREQRTRFFSGDEVVTKKETVQAVLAHCEVRPVPYHQVFTPPVEHQLIGHFGIDPESPAARVQLNRALGNALLRASVVPGPERQPDGTVLDGFGVVWQQTDVNRGAPVSAPLTGPSLAGYRFPDPGDPARLEALAQSIEGNEDLYVAVFVGDLFERASFLRGMENILLDMMLHPGFAHDLLQSIMDYVLASMEEVARLPVDCVFLSDDYGDQRGLLVSPDTWREFIAPELRRFCRRARQLGVAPALHSCGNVRELLPELIDIGFDIIHPLQPEALDVVEVKQTLGGRFTIYGGLDTQRVLPDGTPGDVRALIAERIRELSPGGGFILGPAMKIQHDVPWENVLALLEACREQPASL